MERSVFVTGATSGTGFAIAGRFAKEGYTVFIGSRRQDAADAAAQRIAGEYGVFAKGYQTEIFHEENVRAIFADIRARGYLLDTLVTKKYGGHSECQELGLPVTENGLALPCGCTGRWIGD